MKESYRIEFQGFKKWVKQGTFIISAIGEDGTVWNFTSESMPIFNFGNTKIFQALESGIVEVRGVERGEEFYFSIRGIKVLRVYDFLVPEDSL